jgi:hypothetical protein
MAEEIFKKYEKGLIGDPKYFTKEWMEEKSKEYGIFVERVIHAYEYVSQVQSLGEDIVFKGGSAAQLLFPEELMRFSIDIDLATDIGEDDFYQIPESIKKKFNGEIYNYEKQKRAHGGKIYLRFIIRYFSRTN